MKSCFRAAADAITPDTVRQRELEPMKYLVMRKKALKIRKREQAQ
jgi:hypothetical protein